MAQRRFLLDSDGSNVFHNLSAGEADLDGIVAETVRECPREVTTYLLCSNAGTCYFPTRVGVLDPRAGVLGSALARGYDLFGEMLKGIRASGKETFITMRMNDVHNPEDGDQWNTPLIRRKHPEMVVGADEIARARSGGKRPDWMAYCMDYSHDEVQEYYLALIREMAELYGDTIQGIQLDFMRFPRHLSGGPEEVWSRRDRLTRFVERAREALGGRRGRLRLAARVPPTTAGCRALGMDLETWGREGLVDFLVLCPFLTTNWHIPFDDFRALVGAGELPLYGGFDFGYGSASHHPESLRGVSASLFGCGADGIYVFNFPCWTEYLAARPFHWLSGLGDPAGAAVKPVQLSVPHAVHRNPLTDGPAALPASLPPGASVDVPLFVPAGLLPAWRCLALLHSHGDVSVALNGRDGRALRFRQEPDSGSEGYRSEIFLEFVDQYFRKDSRPAARDCRHFRIDPSVLRAGWNSIQVTNRSPAALEIERANVALW